MEYKKDTTLKRVDGSPYKKCEIQLRDKGTSVTMQIYGPSIDEVKYETGLVSKFKRLKIAKNGAKKMLEFTKESAQVLEKENDSAMVLSSKDLVFDENARLDIINTLEIFEQENKVRFVEKSLFKQAVNELIEVSSLKLSKGEDDSFIIERLEDEIVVPQLKRKRAVKKVDASTPLRSSTRKK